jgi:hypothetical protein
MGLVLLLLAALAAFAAPVSVEDAAVLQQSNVRQEGARGGAPSDRAALDDGERAADDSVAVREALAHLLTPAPEADAEAAGAWGGASAAHGAAGRAAPLEPSPEDAATEVDAALLQAAPEEVGESVVSGRFAAAADVWTLLKIDALAPAPEDHDWGFAEVEEDDGALLGAADAIAADTPPEDVLAQGTAEDDALASFDELPRVPYHTTQ